MREYKIEFTTNNGSTTHSQNGRGRNCQHVFRRIMRQYPDYDFHSLRGCRI